MCIEPQSLMCVSIGSDEGSGNCAHVLYLKPRWLSVCVNAPQALLSARAAPRAATRQLVRSPFLRNLFLSLSCTHCPTSAHKRVHAHTTESGGATEIRRACTRERSDRERERGGR